MLPLDLSTYLQERGRMQRNSHDRVYDPSSSSSGLPSTLSPTKKQGNVNNNTTKPTPPPLPKSPPPLNQPMKRNVGNKNGGGAKLITPAMLRQGVDAPPQPPARRFQFGDDVHTHLMGTSSNVTQRSSAPDAPGAPRPKRFSHVNVRRPLGRRKRRRR